MKTKITQLCLLALVCSGCAVEHRLDGSKVRRLDPSALQLVRDIYVVKEGAPANPAK